MSRRSQEEGKLLPRKWGLTLLVHNEVKFVYPCILKAKTCNLSFYLFQDKLLLIVDVIVDLADIFRDLATYRPEWLGILMSVRVLVSSISVINKIMLST